MDYEAILAQVLDFLQAGAQAPVVSGAQAASRGG